MKEDQKAGALIVAVAITFIAVTIVLSEGWTRSDVRPYIVFQYGETFLDSIVLETRFLLAPLVIVVGYGVIRYFSLIPPLFRRRLKPKDDKG